MIRLMSLAFAALLLAAAPTPPAPVQQADLSSGLVGTEIFLDAGLDRQSSSQNGLSALVAQTILRTPVNGVPLQDAVQAQGGDLTFAVEAHRVRFYLEGTADRYSAMETMLGSAFAHPSFTAATLADARSRLDTRIASDERSALRVGINMLSHAFYPNSQAGSPRYGLPQTLTGFSPDDAAAFYRAHYRRGDAVVSSAGDVAHAGDPISIVQGLAPGTSAPLTLRATPPSKSHQLIARRDVPVPWLVAQYPAPELGSRDFGAMLILTEFLQRTLSEVSDVPGIATRPAAERGTGVLYNFDASPSNVIVYIDGGLGDPVRAFSTALGVVNVIGHAKLSGDLTEMKNFAAGKLLLDSQSLEQHALLAAVFAANHKTGDPLALLVKAINSAQPSDLQRVASRYLNAPTIALVLPRSSQ